MIFTNIYVIIFTDNSDNLKLESAKNMFFFLFKEYFLISYNIPNDFIINLLYIFLYLYHIFLYLSTC